MHGAIAAALVVAFVFSALVALPLLVGVRVSMQRTMRLRRSAPYTPPVAPQRAQPVPLRIEFAEPRDTPATAEGRVLAQRGRRARRAAMVLYVIAGLACATVLAAADLSIAGAEARRAKLAVLLAIHVWPMVLAVVTVSAAARRTKIAILLVAAAVLLLGTTVRTGSAIPWLFYVGPPTLLFLLAANRRLKTIAPLITLFTFALATALMLFVAMFPSTVSCRQASLLGIVLFAVGCAGAALVVMLVVAAYGGKLFSELSFHLAFLWTTFCVAYLLIRGKEPVWWFGLVALGVYALFTTICMPFVRAYVRRVYPASLLVLRVFGAPSRAQTLFDDLGARWRTVGPLHLVAGTDSAIANLDPDEALRYLTFRFRSLFVADAADLERRMQRLDMAPDPDGRYRTNDFFCFDDTWKPTFTRLLERSYAVMLDLGGFNEQNSGVAFELGQLLARRPLDSFVLVTDDNTKLEDLYARMADIWSRLDPGAPNTRVAEPVVRMLHKPSPRQLFAALCDAAVAGGWKPMARLQS